jgi:hypothetical protein
MVSTIGDRKALFVFPSTPREIDHIQATAKLLDQLMATFDDKILLFFGCSSFRDANALQTDRTQAVWNLLLSKAHIISMNETELSDLHTAVVGGGTHQDKPLAYKLLELPSGAIKVCHGAEGALKAKGGGEFRSLKDGREVDADSRGSHVTRMTIVLPAASFARAAR